MRRPAPTRADPRPVAASLYEVRVEGTVMEKGEDGSPTVKIEKAIDVRRSYPKWLIPL